MKKAFTMMELIFVIVILGILAGVAIVKLNFGRNDAEIANAKVLVSSVKSSIMVFYNDALISGNPNYPRTLGCDSKKAFGTILPVGGAKIGTAKRGWTCSGNRYTFSLDNQQKATFEYNQNVVGRPGDSNHKPAGSLVCVQGNLCSNFE